jgi:hypothetical protein
MRITMSGPSVKRGPTSGVNITGRSGLSSSVTAQNLVDIVDSMPVFAGRRSPVGLDYRLRFS